MTRRDYILLASALNNAKPSEPCAIDVEAAWLACVYGIAQKLAQETPRFDSDRFTTACGVEHLDSCPTVDKESVLHPTCYCRRPYKVHA